MKLKPADFVLIGIAVTVIVVFTAFSLRASTGKKQLLIESPEDSYLYSLDDDRIIHVEGPLGDTIIEVADGIVRVTDSPCRDKLCIAYGSFSKTGEWTACLPNRVFIRISGSDKEEDVLIDEVSF